MTSLCPFCLRKKWTGGFSVAFDPLDGSSIVDTNFTVGTIFGVWPGDKLTGVTGRDQVAAAMGIYGPRTTYVLALKDIPGTHEFLLLDEGLFWTMSSIFNLATSQYLVLRILNMNIGCVLAKHVFVSALEKIISYGAWILVFVCGSINCRFVFRKMATCQGHNRNCWRKDVFSWKSESYIRQPRL